MHFLKSECDELKSDTECNPYSPYQLITSIGRLVLLILGIVIGAEKVSECVGLGAKDFVTELAFERLHWYEKFAALCQFDAFFQTFLDCIAF